ncbi:MAG: hypothetical protein V4549_03290 [Bacteroidota bacterium]
METEKKELEYVIVFDAGAKGERYHNNTDFGTGDIYSGSVITFSSYKEAEQYLIDNKENIMGWIEERKIY